MYNVMVKSILDS